MANLERPLKEGNVRSYQEKVGLGYLDILANEVDADLKTIYDAWNAGGAPAGPAGGDLSGVYPNPAVVQSAGSFTVKGAAVVIGNAATKAGLDGSNGNAALVVNHPWGPQDASKPSWAANLDLSGDQFVVQRRAANAATGAVTTLGQITSAGDTYFAGRLRAKSHSGGLMGSGQLVASGQTVEMILGTQWWNTGGMLQTNINQLFGPQFAAVCALHLLVGLTTNGGLGVSVQIENWNGTAWSQIARVASNNQTLLSCSAMWPATAGQFRATLVNATGGNVTVGYAYFDIATVGAY